MNARLDDITRAYSCNKYLGITVLMAQLTSSFWMLMQTYYMHIYHISTMFILTSQPVPKHKNSQESAAWPAGNCSTEIFCAPNWMETERKPTENPERSCLFLANSKVPSQSIASNAAISRDGWLTDGLNGLPRHQHHRACHRYLHRQWSWTSFWQCLWHKECERLQSL